MGRKQDDELSDYSFFSEESGEVVNTVMSGVTDNGDAPNPPLVIADSLVTIPDQVVATDGGIEIPVTRENPKIELQGN